MMTEQPPPDWEQEFVEAGAALEHDRWTRWQKHLFGRCQENSDGSMTISAADVARWKRQIETGYAALSEAEKESDRREAREYLPLVRGILSRLHAGERG
jgi:hypothetical protein